MTYPGPLAFLLLDVPAVARGPQAAVLVSFTTDHEGHIMVIGPISASPIMPGIGLMTTSTRTPTRTEDVDLRDHLAK